MSAPAPPVNDSAAAAAAASKEKKHTWIALGLAVVLIYLVPGGYVLTLGASAAQRWENGFTIPGRTNHTFYVCQDLGVTPPKPPAIPCKDFSALEQEHLEATDKNLTFLGNEQLNIVRKFIGWQYLATLSALVAGSLGAAALLAISLPGWKSAPAWVRSFFIFASASAAFWLAIPQVYQFASNLTTAQKRYALASTTVWQIRSVRATGRDAQGIWVEPHKFVTAASARIPEVAIGIVFDESKAVPGKIELPSGLKP